MSEKIELELVKKEIDGQLQKTEIVNSLLETTFKGLNVLNMRKALFEGMARGFSFEDFLKKNIYAIPFSSGYSLITSIDYARKVGMKNGVCGKSAPKFVEDKDGKIISCEVTIKRRVDGYVGDYTDLVYFDEYYKKPKEYGGRKILSLWDTKPKTMIAKVAEMHALRMACPEDLSQMYIEEEMDQESENVIDLLDEETKKKVDSINNIEELRTYYLENKGKGKEFDKYVTTRKQILEQTKTEDKKDENTQSTTGN